VPCIIEAAGAALGLADPANTWDLLGCQADWAFSDEASIIQPIESEPWLA